MWTASTLSPSTASTSTSIMPSGLRPFLLSSTSHSQRVIPTPRINHTRAIERAEVHVSVDKSGEAEENAPAAVKRTKAAARRARRKQLEMKRAEGSGGVVPPSLPCITSSSENLSHPSSLSETPVTIPPVTIRPANQPIQTSVPPVPSTAKTPIPSNPPRAALGILSLNSLPLPPNQEVPVGEKKKKTRRSGVKVRRRLENAQNRETAAVDEALDQDLPSSGSTAKISHAADLPTAPKIIAQSESRVAAPSTPSPPTTSIPLPPVVGSHLTPLRAPGAGSYQHSPAKSTTSSPGLRLAWDTNSDYPDSEADASRLLDFEADTEDEDEHEGQTEPQLKLHTVFVQQAQPVSQPIESQNIQSTFTESEASCNPDISINDTENDNDQSLYYDCNSEYEDEFEAGFGPDGGVIDSMIDTLEEQLMRLENLSLGFDYPDVSIPVKREEVLEEQWDRSVTISPQRVVPPFAWSMQSPVQSRSVSNSPRPNHNISMMTNAEEARLCIDLFFSNAESFTANPNNKLRLWQALCLELGLVESPTSPSPTFSNFSYMTDRATPSLSYTSSLSRTSSHTSSSRTRLLTPPLTFPLLPQRTLAQFPTTLRAASNILRAHAHINLADYLQARSFASVYQGYRPRNYAYLLHPSANAMKKYTAESGRYVDLGQVKVEWLQPLLRDFGMKKGKMNTRGVVRR